MGGDEGVTHVLYQEGSNCRCMLLASYIITELQKDVSPSNSDARLSTACSTIYPEG